MNILPLERLIRCEEFALKAIREIAFASHHILESSDLGATSLQVRCDIDEARKALHEARQNLTLILDEVDTHLAENDPPAPAAAEPDIITPDQASS